MPQPPRPCSLPLLPPAQAVQSHRTEREAEVEALMRALRAARKEVADRNDMVCAPACLTLFF